MDSQTGGHRRSLFTILMFFFAVACVCSGCFITNCPPGGKRSGSAFGRVPVRQCAKCGSGGRCFGPSICCSQTSGCLVADRTSTNALFRPCAIEAVLPGVCESGGGKPCGGSSGGRCASRGICCDNVSCSTDASCLVSAVKMEPTSYPEKIYGNTREDIADVKTYAEGYGTLDGNVVSF